ncbi:MAG: hypothetical protein ACPGF7_10305 [Pontibacterium sp.]
MNIIIRVTSDKNGSPYFVNVHNIIHFTQAEGSTGTRLYFTSGEISHLVVKESPGQVLALIDKAVSGSRA